jgi:hypothetical protein
MLGATISLRIIKYIGHIITNDLLDDVEVQHESRNMFLGLTILLDNLDDIQCLLNQFCLWLFVLSCHNKCMKVYFSYQCRYSMTQIIFDCSLPRFKIIIASSSALFSRYNTENHYTSKNTSQSSEAGMSKSPNQLHLTA